MTFRLIALVGLAAASVAGAASAQATNSSNQSVGMSASVSSLCILGAPNPASVDLGQLAATSGTRVGKLTTVANRTITLPGSFCNYAGTRLTVSSSALVAADTSAVQPGFSRAVNFTSSVANWAPTAATVTTAASAGGATPSASATGGSQAAPKLADLTLTLSNFTAPSDALLVAGGYTGSVVVTVGPDAAP